jgi:hypothetical protein
MWRVKLLLANMYSIIDQVCNLELIMDRKRLRIIFRMNLKILKKKFQKYFEK